MNRRTICKEIEAAKLSNSFLDDPLHLFWPTDVTQFSTQCAALCIGVLLQFAVCSSLDATCEDTCTCCGKPEGDSTADPAGPGDNGYFAEELLHGWAAFPVLSDPSPVGCARIPLLSNSLISEEAKV